MHPLAVAWEGGVGELTLTHKYSVTEVRPW